MTVPVEYDALLQTTQDIVDKAMSVLKFKKLVEKSGVSQKALAKYLWTSPSHLSALLVGDMEVYSHAKILHFTELLQEALDGDIPID
jgi:DNA-binding transcriptional regulator YiaG